MSFARNVATVGIATLGSRLLAFGRDVGIAAVLGAGSLSDAFFAALLLPNLFRRLLAEGALNSAYVPMWLRVREERGAPAARAFAENIMAALLVGLSLIALLCILFAPAAVQVLAPGFEPAGERFDLAVRYVRLSAFYVLLAGMVAVGAATLNGDGRVRAAAAGPVAFNVVLLAAVLGVVLAGWGQSPAAGAVLSAAVVLAGVAQFAVIALAMFGLPGAPIVPRLRTSMQLRRFFRQAGPGVLAGGVPQLKLMAGLMIASASPDAVSWLYYANRLYELPLGVVSVAISAVMVPLIATSLRSGDRAATAAAQARAVEIALGFSLPAALAFALLAHEIVGGLFERGAFGPQDTAAVAAALAAICAGLPGHTLEKALAAVAYAHEDTHLPMLAALAGLATAVGGALLLFPSHGHVGIAAAIAVSGWVGAALLTAVLRRRGWLAAAPGTWARLGRIAAAALAMAMTVLLLRLGLAGRFDTGGSALARAVSLALLVAAGLAAELIMLHVLRVVSLAQLVAALRRAR